MSKASKAARLASFNAGKATAAKVERAITVALAPLRATTHTMKKAPIDTNSLSRVRNASVEAFKVTADNRIRARGYDVVCHVAANQESRKASIREQKSEKFNVTKDGKIVQRCIGATKRLPSRVEYVGMTATIYPNR